MSEAPIITAPAEPSHAEQLVPVAMPVIQKVAAMPVTQEVPWYKTATGWGQALAVVSQVAPAILAVSRANPKQQAQTQLGLGLAAVILSLWNKPQAP